ncbi:hypothetical protein XW81_01180 [Buchnera aphidicola (Schlechtendalia chinensis)]|uniref:Protein GrpE n=1 Tax=Buchnera aphidicola subsp. Schlechtendalia chinensis TaxID=118110 RepID=A0A172WEG2_BUCSC|nr:hypothetical protein XW81_01180 [Buchnera aphidicola (Schlechtendalia chinensis)]
MENINQNENSSIIDSNLLSEKIDILNKNIEDLNSDLLKKKILRSERIRLFRNRIEKDISNTHKFSLSNFISSLLPIIDNVERALHLFDKNDKNLTPIFCELENIFQSFLKFLEKFGIKVIDEFNVPFNPEMHQAMVTKPCNDNKKENYVISIMQKGYLINERLLRPALVVVSKFQP